ADADMAYLDGDAAERVKAEIRGIVEEYALREFGLRLKVLNVRREATDVEKSARATELANERLRIEAAGKLEQHLIQLMANGGGDEEIAQARKRLATLKAYGAGDEAGRGDAHPETSGGGVAAQVIAGGDRQAGERRANGSAFVE
ncbi:MAG TPA: hypothetical protein VNZ44_19940, partial [Pyrinomonadaceae bacterium]|nr:hypothetical protein [Pyrinomonadaceae bacterium]